MSKEVGARGKFDIFLDSGKVYSSGSNQWCRSKPIARGVQFIARGALFLQASV